MAGGEGGGQPGPSAPHSALVRGLPLMAQQNPQRRYPQPGGRPALCVGGGYTKGVGVAEATAMRPGPGLGRRACPLRG